MPAPPALAPPPAEAAPHGADRPSPSPVSGPETPAGLVLVVDDDALAAESLAALVRAQGWAVHVAADALQTLALLDVLRPDGILLDIDMPVMDGFTLARRVRETAGEATVLVAVTGWRDLARDVSPRTSVFDHVLGKPVDPAALQRLLPAR